MCVWVHMVCVCGLVGKCGEGGGGSIVAQLYLGGNVFKNFVIHLLQIFISMRYCDYLRSKMTCFNSDQDGL